MDFIFDGQVVGTVAQRLAAANFSANALRPFLGEKGGAFINNHDNSGVIPTTNALLRKDEWLQLDKTVIDIARNRLGAVSDLVSRGLVYNIPNGLGTTVLQWEDVSDMTSAEIDMDGVTRGKNSRLNFELRSLPLPITHKEFQINIRTLTASRNMGQPLDTMQAAVCSRKISESNEQALFTGISGLTFAGGSVYGYLNAPNRNQVSLAKSWSASGTTGSEILADVLAMKQASLNSKRYGPWVLYIPTGYEVILDDDFKTNSDKSVKTRILEVSGIQSIKVSDYLTADNVVLVEMSPDVVRMVIGMNPTVVDWGEQGGMINHFKVMSIMVPQVRYDQNGSSGITHLA